VALWAFLLAPQAGLAADAADAPTEDAAARAGSEPALCREAIAAQPDAPIAALRRAESARWEEARRAHARARRRLRRALGDVPGARLQADAEGFGRLAAGHHRAMREARVLCECRARRGDPDGAPCERLYPQGGAWPDPPAPAPDGAAQEPRPSQDTSADAAAEDSGS
jgi:hypothetical protein